MVFSSIQAYLDSSNWRQSNYNYQSTEAISGGGGAPSSQPPQPQSHGSEPGLIRPGSMVDRARMANIPIPEAPLPCPRCDSTNTKFCYFNNYSLRQPRHFCKSCRRYWTHGGTLRKVPVGGGYRRNRRASTSTGNNNNNAGMTSSGAVVPSSYSGGGGQLDQILSPGVMNHTFNNLNAAGNISSLTNGIGLLNYRSVSEANQDLSSIHMGIGGGGGWRPLTHPPQLLETGGGAGNSEDPWNYSGFNPFEARSGDHESMYLKTTRISPAISSTLALVKAEDNPYKWSNCNGAFSSWMDISSFGSSG